MSPRVPVTFLPTGSTCWVEPGATVLDAAKSADVTVPAPCGGRGVCGACGVRVVDGALEPPDAAESAGLARAPSGVRLACRARISGPATLRPVIAYRSSGVAPAESTGELIAAVDLGTTNVAAAVVELRSGREVGRALAPNRQSVWGADVLTRISAAADGSGEDLTRAARASVGDAIRATGVDPARIVRVAIAANTAMTGFFTGADVTKMGIHPFGMPELPRSLEAGACLGDLLGHGVSVDIVPPLAGFVGGDVTAGLIGTGLSSSAATVLFVDVGTNAEIALVHGRDVIVASAAAGPAFDGVGLSAGGPVAEGAVVAVRLAGNVMTPDVLGEGDARWLGGSGMVSMLARLVESGHLDEDGRMHVRGPLESRFSTDDAGVVRVCPFADAPGVCFTQLDVRSLQLAKAAVRTGIRVLLGHAGVDASRLDAIVLAGAFGAALEPGDLRRIGMVPPTDAVVSAAGNASLQGAIALALDPERLNIEVGGLLERVTHVELASEPGFNAELMHALRLAEVD